MIAVYYNDNSSPYTMLVVEVKNSTPEAFVKAIIGDDPENYEYPIPSGDVLIIENDHVIEHFKPGKIQSYFEEVK